MPFRWEPGKKSPYACNHFAVLRVGPNTRRAEIKQTSDDALRALQTGNTAQCACGHTVDVHEIGHATSQLLEAGSLAEELLLIHPQPASDNRAKVKALVGNLHRATALSLDRAPIPLRNPSALFWFLTAPSPDAIALPSLRELGLVQAGDPTDVALDIVFDS